MNTNEKGGIGGRRICSGKFEGVRIGELDREELAFEARRGCSRYGDRSLMRLYISALGKRERRGVGSLGSLPLYSD
jgi:hypothetical protein